MTETITEQARYLARKYNLGGQLIGDSIGRDDPPEIQQAVAKGAQLGQSDRFGEDLARIQGELIQDSQR